MFETLGEFLEKAPLFTKAQGIRLKYNRELVHSKLQLHCELCKDIRTFAFPKNPRATTGAPVAMGRGSNEPVPADFRDDSVVTISYRCTDCEHFTYHFLLYIGAEYKFMEKYGQFPKPRIQLSPALEQGLGDQTKIFRSGYISEQHGFGIGAFAYYRRAVEKLVEELLRQLEELCSDEEKVKYQEALAQTRTELSADKRISLVKNFVPARVCQAGINPLAALYDSLSQDIHNASDEDCLAYAELTRLTISQVIEAIQHHRGTQKTLTENTRKLLDKIASKKKR